MPHPASGSVQACRPSGTRDGGRRPPGMLGVPVGDGRGATVPEGAAAFGDPPLGVSPAADHPFPAEVVEARPDHLLRLGRIGLAPGEAAGTTRAARPVVGSGPGAGGSGPAVGGTVGPGGHGQLLGQGSVLGATYVGVPSYEQVPSGVAEGRDRAVSPRSRPCGRPGGPGGAPGRSSWS